MRKRNALSAIFFVVLLLLSTAASAMTVYMKNGDEIDAASAWQKDGKVFVKVNRDVLLDFPSAEVSLDMTFAANNRPLKVRTKAGQARTGDKDFQRLVMKSLEMSGFNKQIDAIPEQIKSQAVNAPASLDPQIQESVMQIMLDSFNPDAVKRTAQAYFRKHADSRTLENIISWLESPLGRKITEAEMSKVGEGPEGLQRYLAEIENNPPSASRMALMTSLEKETKATELTVKMITDMIKGFVRVSATTPAEKARLLKETDKEIKKMLPAMKNGLRQQMIASLLYTYSELSDEEMGRYLRFTKTESGKKFNALAFGALGKAMESMFAQVQHKVMETVKGQKGRTANI